MTNKKILVGMLALMLSFGMVVIGCGGGSIGPVNLPQTVQYEGIDTAGNAYILTITENIARATYVAAAGDSYELIIRMANGTEKISRGTVTAISVDGTFTLQPSVGGSTTFSVTVSVTGISSITGTIAVEGGGIVTPHSFTGNSGGDDDGDDDGDNDGNNDGDNNGDNGDNDGDNDSDISDVVWYKWIESSADVTLDFEEQQGGVIKVTVGGTLVPAFDKWKAAVGYTNSNRILQQGKDYKYKFEMWTDSGTRNVSVQYYNDEDTKTYYEFRDQPVTAVRKTYELVGVPHPKAKVEKLDFQCGDTAGVFYVKIISITEINEGVDDGSGTWWTWVDDTADVTVGFEEQQNGIVKATVSGTPASDRWKAMLGYTNSDQTLQQGKHYKYKFEMWTDSGTRKVNVQYYNDEDTAIYHGFNNQTVTTERKTYELAQGIPHPKAKAAQLGFQCGDTTGVFYVRIISITEISGSEVRDYNKYTREVYLRLSQYGEDNNGNPLINWGTGGLKIKDFYSETLKPNTKYTFYIWGSVDQYLSHFGGYLFNNEWQQVATLNFVNGNLSYEFSTTAMMFYFTTHEDDFESIKDTVFLGLWNSPSNMVAPDGVPLGTIMATISNFYMTIIEDEDQ
jgi:hypothetical protein